MITCAHLWHHYKLYMWGKYSSILGAQNLRHKQKSRREKKSSVKKKNTNFSLLTSHADLELFGWQFVNHCTSLGAGIINYLIFQIKRCQMFGKVLPVCLHNLHVNIVSHIWIFACIIHKLFIRNIITTDIRLCQSKAMFLRKTSFTKIALLTGS